tara:strand:- start:4 stop:258 length:255 start_codon:yes stop_codon:yes gene_type:complete
MIQKRTHQPLFFIQCGDWETVRAATSPFKACIDALLEARRKYGKSLKLSSVVVAMNLQEQMEQNDEAISAFNLDTIRDFLKNEN